MTITRIKLMRDCGVFHGYSWPNDLHEFSRYNLIYGWNGSGKTTLSKIFRALENQSKPPNGHVTVTIDGHDVSNDNFSRVTLPVHVFNRDFRDEIIFPTEGSVAPILVLGKENVEKQKQVVQIKQTLTEEQKKLSGARQQSINASNTLDQFCIAKAKVIKDLLRSSGSNPYNNYNKSDFTQRAEKIASANYKTAHIINDDNRDKLLAQLRSSPKSKIPTITYRLPDLKFFKKAVAEFLSATVASAVVQSLKDDAKLSSWVHTGFGIHQERSSEKCLFCDQPMPKDRMSTLEAHFSTEYIDLMQKLDGQIDALQANLKATTGLIVPNAAEFYDDLKLDYEKASTALRKECDSAKLMLAALIKALEDKKNRAFDRVALNVTIPDLNTDVIESLNKIIIEHNRVCDDFQSRINLAREQLEADSAGTNLDEFLKLKDAMKVAKSEVSKTDNEVQRISIEISKLEREIVEHRRPAEELNEDLRKYLGHSELRLAIKETGYAIMRHDELAEGISEGEMTAIALLYFLKSLQDRRFDLKKGVVVLDDPVSSLDANALYYAFGFIREHTENVKQLFILTHNFTFFQQVRNWFHHLKGQSKRDISQRPARFYMVDCTHDGSRRCATLCALDPLLELYNSEYHYLFARIYRKAQVSTQVNLEENYVFPNMARRLLEAFLAFRQPQIAGELWKKLQSVQFDESKKTRILRFFHTHSHSGAVGEPEHDPSILCEANAVLKDLLDLIRSQDPEHFSAMEKLIKSSTDEEEEKS